MNKSTLKSIAEKLGVSISTVSRALKDHPDIKKETRDRIKQLAEIDEYEPNFMAVNLRTKKNKLLGLIVPKLSQFFYHSVISAIDEQVRLAGYSLLILQSNDTLEKEIENTKICMANRIDGLFVALSSETTSYAHFDKLIQKEIPVLFFDKVPSADIYNKVSINDIEAASLAAREILVRSKTNILAIFGNSNLSISRKRNQGFVSTIEKFAPATELHIMEASSSAEAQLSTERFLKNATKMPDVIFNMSDEILVGTMQTMMKLGIKIPQEIGIVTLSNGIVPDYYFPSISYIETSGSKLGKMCVHRMFEMINGDPFIQEQFLGVQFIEKDSL